MINIGYTFSRPEWLLMLPPSLWLLWHLYQARPQNSPWYQLLPPHSQAFLLSGTTDQSHRRSPVLLLGLAWLLSLIALAGPSQQASTEHRASHADPLVVVLEMTPELYATDTLPTRLQQARYKLLDLLRLRQQAQTGIVVFAGSAHTLVPLSNDIATSQNLLEGLTPDLMPLPGHQADLGIQTALELLDRAQLGQGRLLLMTTRLTSQERNQIRQLLKDRPESLSILGVGTEQGAPILLKKEGHFQLDAQGNILVSRLDAQGLERFAQEHQGRYQTLSLDDRDLQKLNLLTHSALGENTQKTAGSDWQDQGHWLLLPLLAIAALGARKSWLFCLLPLCILMPSPAQASEWSWQNLWQRPDQQAYQLLQQHQPEAAASLFENPQWRGIAYYQAGFYTQATAAFAQLDTASAHYNRANALVLSGQLEAALNAYDQALEQQPDLIPARYNRKLVEHWLQASRDSSNSPALESLAGPTGEAITNPPPSTAEGQNSRQDSADSDTSSTSQTQSQSTSTLLPFGLTEDLVNTPNPETLPHPLGTQSPQQQQNLEQWLRRIPDNPSELLRRKFLYEQQERQIPY